MVINYLILLHTYIHIFISTRWHDFRKNIQINITKLYKNTKTKKEGITI